MSKPIEVSHDTGGYIWINGQATRARLSRKELETFQAIMRSRSVATYDFIMSYIYGGRDEPEIKTLHAFICIIRRKLGKHRIMIETALARGYSRNPAYVLVPHPGDGVNIELGTDLIERLTMLTGYPADYAVRMAVMQKILELEKCHAA